MKGKWFIGGSIRHPFQSKITRRNRFGIWFISFFLTQTQERSLRERMCVYMKSNSKMRHEDWMYTLKCNSNHNFFFLGLHAIPTRCGVPSKCKCCVKWVSTSIFKFSWNNFSSENCPILCSCEMIDELTSQFQPKEK